MKIALLGHSPLALEAALRFHSHGAALTWFIDRDDFTLFDSCAFDPGSFTSDLGRRVLTESGLTYSPRAFTWKEWSAAYFKPLHDYLKQVQEIKSDQVISVGKRFLAPGEKITGRSRFLDLFRVIYRVNPKEFIEQQKTTNPETYQHLSEELVNSLSSTLEMYQDYDLILDLRSDLSKASASVSGRALGEGRASDKVSYGLQALKYAGALTAGPDHREICLVGSDSLAAEILLKLESWLQDPSSRLFVVTTEEEPFEEFLRSADPQTADKLHHLFLTIDQEFEQEVTAFSTKLREWQELDDFVQVKIPKPVEPIPRLNYFSGHNVAALDELIDKRRLFITLEKPEFRSGRKHVENNRLELKTIGADHVFIAHAQKDSSFFNIDEGEPGFFAVTPSRINLKDSWIKDLIKLQGIEDEVFKLFSPAHPH